MSFFSHIGSVIHHVVSRPFHSIAKVIHNPTAALLNKSVRSSKGFKRFARPVIKIGTGVALGAVTGGIGLAGFAGLSGAGAIAGGLASTLAGGFSSKAFKPLNNVVFPAAAGAAAGAFSRLSAASKAALNPFSTTATTTGSTAGAAATTAGSTAGTAATAGGGFFAGAGKFAAQTAVGLLVSRTAGGGGGQQQDQFVYDTAGQGGGLIPRSAIFDVFGNPVDPTTADPNGTYFDAAGNAVQTPAPNSAKTNQTIVPILGNKIKELLKKNNINPTVLLTGAAIGGLKGGFTGAAIGAGIAVALAKGSTAKAVA